MAGNSVLCFQFDVPNLEKCVVVSLQLLVGFSELEFSGSSEIKEQNQKI